MIYYDLQFCGATSLNSRHIARFTRPNLLLQTSYVRKTLYEIRKPTYEKEVNETNCVRKAFK